MPRNSRDFARKEMNPLSVLHLQEPIFRHFNDFFRKSYVLSIKYNVKYKCSLIRKINMYYLDILYNNKFCDVVKEQRNRDIQRVARTARLQV